MTAHPSTSGEEQSTRLVLMIKVLSQKVGRITAGNPFNGAHNSLRRLKSPTNKLGGILSSHHPYQKGFVDERTTLPLITPSLLSRIVVPKDDNKNTNLRPIRGLSSCFNPPLQNYHILTLRKIILIPFSQGHSTNRNIPCNSSNRFILGEWVGNLSIPVIFLFRH